MSNVELTKECVKTLIGARGNGLREAWKCPVCEDTVTDFPAISRRDESTEICSECGVREAMADFFASHNE